MIDGFEFNKIAGAVLFTVLIGFGVAELSGGLIHADNHGEVAYPVPEIPEDGAPAAAAADEPAVSIGTLLANADIAKGEKVFKKCAACHTTEDGGKDKVGPNLHGILDRDIASKAGFSYSATLSDMEGGWTYDNLNHFLADPKGYAKGTKMAFAGVKKDSDRASLILFLRSQGDADTPLPAAE